jgi:DNA-binding MarR family transcriptional regulator
MDKINPQQTAFYSIEKAIKAYRKMAQKNISQVVTDITLDQIQVLNILNSNPDCSQKDIAEILFKDYASITRMIELLVKKEYLVRQIHEQDRRMFHLVISEKGNETISKLKPIILKNRLTALNSISEPEIIKLSHSLNKIINNCSQ